MPDFQTRAFDAQTHIVDGIRAAQLLDQSPIAAWTVTFGLPGRRDELHIFVDDAIDEWNQSAPATGLGGREERFQIPIHLYVRRTGADAEETRDLLVAAAGVVANLIGADPTLGGQVLYAELSAGGYDSKYADEQGRVREALLMLTVSCRAYLA